MKIDDGNEGKRTMWPGVRKPKPGPAFQIEKGAVPDKPAPKIEPHDDSAIISSQNLLELRMQLAEAEKASEKDPSLRYIVEKLRNEIQTLEGKT